MPQEQILLDKASARFNDYQINRIRKALILAKKAHSKQKRLSGENYIYHPLETALLLEDLKLDADTIIAGILHDTVEDTEVDLSRIKKDFGKDVAHLVEGVTKLSKIRLKKSWFGIGKKKLEEIPEFERQVETLRKMLLSTSKDIRVIFIKLADRIHNIRTLDSVPPESQVRIATETLDIYATLADRLGIGQWRGELEDLSFKYIYPDEYSKLSLRMGRILKRKKNEVEKAKKLLMKFLIKSNIKVIDVHGRVKRIYSLWMKLKRYDNDLSSIFDLVALRVIVENEEDCYRTLGIIHDHWRPLPDRIKDYIALPKPNGYQSIHTTVAGPGGKIIEIQIRDKKMHEKAEQGIAAHWYYENIKPRKKSLFFSRTKKPQPIPKYIGQWFKELSSWQKNIKDLTELKDNYQFDFFKDRIFIYTPQGDVKDLPMGATPIDFAFSVHSEVGNRCIGAKANGKIISLSHELANGDVVEILTTKKNKKANKDWLRFVKTSVARNHIRRSQKN